MGKQQPLKERLVALLYRLAKRDSHGFFAVPVDPELVSAPARRPHWGVRHLPPLTKPCAAHHCPRPTQHIPRPSHTPPRRYRTTTPSSRSRWT